MARNYASWESITMTQCELWKSKGGKCFLWREDFYLNEHQPIVKKGHIVVAKLRRPSNLLNWITFWRASDDKRNHPAPRWIFRHKSKFAFIKTTRRTLYSKRIARIIATLASARVPLFTRQSKIPVTENRSQISHNKYEHRVVSQSLKETVLSRPSKVERFK